MQGGLKFYRGSAAAARSYVEADHSRADDYYLAEGSGVAEHYVAGPGVVRRVGDLDGATYERWVAGYDVLTGAAKGRLRDDPRALRFVEVVINGPKSWSLAAALHPDIATAYDAAMDRAAGEVIGWVAEHATTRVGPRGRRVQPARCADQPQRRPLRSRMAGRAPRRGAWAGTAPCLGPTRLGGRATRQGRAPQRRRPGRVRRWREVTWPGCRERRRSTSTCSGSAGACRARRSTR